MLAEIRPLYETFRLCSNLFRNCLVGVDDETAQVRLNGNTNNLLFLAVHLTDARYYMYHLMGRDYSPPFPSLETVRSVDEMPEDSPSITLVLELWNEITPKIADRFDILTESDLNAESPFAFYPSDAMQDVRMALAFLLNHEGYHIGQMALIRKGLGLPAMEYE